MDDDRRRELTMVEMVSATGKSRTFTLSISRMLQVEEEEPSFRFFHELDAMGDLDAPKWFTRVDRICRLFGVSYETLVKEGFTAEDLTRACQQCLPDLGFSGASATTSDPTVPAASGKP